jgi:flagellar assembly protein FliH
MLDEEGYVDPAAVLNQAREEAEQLVREAYAEGMRRGLEAGQKKFEESIGEASALIAAAAEELKQARGEFMEQMTPEIARLVGAIAQRILRREARIDGAVVSTTAHAALERLCDQERVILRVHPDDLKGLKEQRIALLEEFDGIERLEIVPNDQVTPGGCFAESQALFVDARLEEQLQRILDELER